MSNCFFVRDLRRRGLITTDYTESFAIVHAANCVGLRQDAGSGRNKFVRRGVTRLGLRCSYRISSFGCVFVQSKNKDLRGDLRGFIYGELDIFFQSSFLGEKWG